MQIPVRLQLESDSLFLQIRFALVYDGIDLFSKLRYTNISHVCVCVCVSE